MKKVKIVLFWIRHYCVYNMVGIFRILKSFVKSTRQYELKQLKNRHKGERCFIVATGPSLQIEDVEKLKNEITFSVNSIFLIHDKTNWRSTYYVCTDTNHFSNMMRLYGDKMDMVCKREKFFNITSAKELKKKRVHISDSAFIDISPINKLTDDSSNVFKFTTNLVKGIYSSGTVTNIAIIIAAYMGFKDIYLIGVDCNYSGAKKHVAQDFNDKDISETQKTLAETRMRNGFRLIATRLKKRGINVYNATRGGMLEEFVRVDFDSLFSKEEWKEKMHIWLKEEGWKHLIL